MISHRIKAISILIDAATIEGVLGEVKTDAGELNKLTGELNTFGRKA